MASSKTIKGITIEIEGKTSSLVKSLDEVNKNLRVTQDNLKTVNKALKLDSSNFEALKQKQDLLNTAIEETKEKLELEKKAAEDAAKALEEGTITQGQYDTLQAEVAKTTAELTKLESEATNVASAIDEATRSSINSVKKLGDAISETGDKIQSLGNKMSDAGKNMSVVSGAVVAVGKGAVDAFNEVDAGMDIIVEKTGAAGDSLIEMENIAKNIATTIPTDFATAGEAVGEINTRFGLVGDDLEDLSTKFIKFSKLNKTDVSSSIDDVQKIMTAYGLSIEQVGALLDKLNATGQKTGIDVAKLESAMITNSAALQEMGMSAASAAEFLGQIEMSGADSSQVLSGLSKALKNATDDGMSISEALQMVENNMLNANNETEALAYAYEVFGTKAGAAIYEACKNGSLSLKELHASMTSSLGSVDDTFESTLDGTDDMTVAMNSLKEASAELGGTVAKVLSPILKGLANNIKSVSEWYKKLSPSVQEAIIKAGMFIAVLGPLVLIIGKIIASVGTVISVIGSLVSYIGGTVLPLLSTCIAPIAAVVLAITAVITVIKNWESISELFSIAWEAFCNLISSLSSSLKDGLISIFSGIYNGISDSLASIRDFAVNIWNNITSSVTELAGTIKSNVIDTFVNLKNGVTEKITNIKDTIVSGITTAVDFIKSLPEQALTWGKDMIQNFIDGIKAKMNELTDALKSVGNKITSFLGFSIPDEGPLSKADTWMPDMMDLLSETMLGSMGRLDGALNAVGQNISMKMQGIDYSNQLDAISGQLAGIGGDVVIPVYIGNDKIDNLVVSATQRNNFRSGGR